MIKDKFKSLKLVNKNDKNKFLFIKNINFEQNNAFDQKLNLLNFFII